MSRWLSLVLMFSLAAGCVFTETDSSGQASEGEPGEGEPGDDDGDFDRDDCKIEGGQIGVEGAAIEFGDLSVVFTDWVAKDGEPGEFVGFTMSVDGMAYRVKAGGETHDADTAVWLHPNGTGGPDVPGISNVDVCPPDGEVPPGDGEDPPGDDPECVVDSECASGEFCEEGTCLPPGDDPECVVDSDCATGEFCEEGTCLPKIL